jgi:DnaJ-class molecular chaperone
MSLVWHPDKHHGKETEEDAVQKFMEIKSAYDLLCEGLEKGNVDGVTVSMAGELGGGAGGEMKKLKAVPLAKIKIKIPPPAATAAAAAAAAAVVAGAGAGGGGAAGARAAPVQRKTQSLADLAEGE